MTSVERVTEYAELPPEAALESSDKNRPSPDWPQNGSIVVKDACYRYAPHGPMVLKYLNFTINPREKVGLFHHTCRSRDRGYCHHHVWLCVCASAFRFRTISQKEFARLFSYFTHTCHRGCRCAFWGL